MKSKLILIAMLPLAGCATTSTADLRKLPITATFKSDKPITEVAQCLAENLNNLGVPSIYPTASGVTVSFTGGGNTLALFDLARDGTIEVRAPLFMQKYKSKTNNCL